MRSMIPCKWPLISINNSTVYSYEKKSIATNDKCLWKYAKLLSFNLKHRFWKKKFSKVMHSVRTLMRIISKVVVMKTFQSLSPNTLILSIINYTVFSLFSSFMFQQKIAFFKEFNIFMFNSLIKIIFLINLQTFKPCSRYNILLF